MSKPTQSLDELTADARRFRDFNANFPGAIFVYDLTPDGTDSVSYISEKCFDIWEVHAKDVVKDATPLWAIIAPEDVPVMQESIQKSAREMSPWHCRWRVVTSSKTEKWLEGWGQPSRLEDGTIRWNSMILDVSRYRKAEIALEASRERAISARHLESIGALSSGIAHDFNNLLTVIAGHVELMRLKCGQDQSLEPILANLAGAIDRGASLAKNLLSYSRRHQSVEEVIDLSLFARQFEELCKRTLSPRVRFSSLVDVNFGSLYIDVGMLQSSLLNLVLNGRDAIEDQGNIVVRYSLDEASQQLVISVSDSGTGISSDAKEHLFEPFYTTKPIGQGTGLGLSLVRDFVEKYEGRVQVDSELGKGTAISLRLPIDRLRERQDGRPSSSVVLDGESGRKGTQVDKAIQQRVLVVEDDPDILEMIMDVLRLYGFEPLGANSGDSALPFLEGQEKIDALISDVMMPGSLLGTDLVGKARTLRPKLPIILMSGYVDISRGSPLDVLEKHPDVAFLQKPARPDEIVAQLKRILA